MVSNTTLSIEHEFPSRKTGLLFQIFPSSFVEFYENNRPRRSRCYLAMLFLWTNFLPSFRLSTRDISCHALGYWDPVKSYPSFVKCENDYQMIILFIRLSKSGVNRRKTEGGTIMTEYLPNLWVPSHFHLTFNTVTYIIHPRTDYWMFLYNEMLKVKLANTDVFHERCFQVLKNSQAIPT